MQRAKPVSGRNGNHPDRAAINFEIQWVEIISKQNIPGITGGALDSREGQPGPLMIQGDHGPIRFRKVDLTPAR